MKNQKTKIAIVLFIGLMFSCIPIIGQGPDLKFEHFIDEKGFTQNSVLNILQDKDGYLWIGTPNGLYKYDGQRFTTYKHILNNANSLVNNSVYELEMDALGNILIGTGRGLSKFDKLTQTFYTFPSILENARITAIYPEKNGSLWVGTLHSGLYHFNKTDKLGDKPERYFHQPDEASSINSNQIHAITKDNAGNLWVGTVKGLNKMSTTRTKSPKGFIHFDALNQSIKSLFLDKKKRLWVGLTGPKLVEIVEPDNFESPDATNFKEFFFDIDKTNVEQEGPEYGGLIAISEGSDNNLWIGIHGHGLYWFNPETRSYRLYAPDPLKPESLSSSNVETILVDRTNVLWVGTGVGGLNKCDLEKKNIQFLSRNPLSKNTLSDPSINAIIKGEGNSIWVGTENGLNTIDFKDNNYTKPLYRNFYLQNEIPKRKATIEQPVWSILKDSEGDYWIGGNGITHMKKDPLGQNHYFSSTDIDLSQVHSILEDRNGFLWFGSSVDGLIKWKKKRFPNSITFDFSEAAHYLPDISKENSLSGEEISCLYEDSKGNIWVGTLLGGLNLMLSTEDEQQNNFISYQHDPDNPNSLSHNSVYAIHEDKIGNYWIGTFGGGLNKMTLPTSPDIEPVFEHYRENDGLADDVIYGILEDDSGNLWISTDNGISQFNPKTETFKNLYRGDGLQSNNFRKNAYFKNNEGYLFFGGLRGLNIFHPKDLKDNTAPAEAILTAFKIKNELIKVGQEYNGRVLLNKSLLFMDDNEITLKHHENTITFEFAALHFAAPEKNQFSYQLTGFDTDWESSKGLAFAHYTNLSPGSYTFKVKATNNDGIWNEKPASIKFEISPPFWLTGWAYFLYSMAVLGMLIGIRSYYRLQSKERIAVKVQKEIEEVNKLKLQFFTNISHDFKTPITLILNPVEEILENLESYSSLHPKMTIIQRNANYLLRLVNQLMEFRKIEVGEIKLITSKSNIINFIREITFSFQAFAKKKNIELSFESQLYEFEVWFDWDKLEKILNNIISNAIKYTTDGGRITIRVYRPQAPSVIEIKDREAICEYICIEVEDNGQGISQDQLPFVFQRFYQVDKSKNNSSTGSGIGLAITKDLVDLHHGVIEVDSTLEKGSRFVLKLPLGNEHLLAEEMTTFYASKPLNGIEMDKEEVIHEDNKFIESNSSKTEISVLIVDDNSDIRLLVSDGLASKYQIFEATNGKEALNIALKEIPDIIISDVMMPEMDGIEFCHKLKNNIRTSHIPVILLTALNSVEHRIEGIESGAEAYIPKPFKMRLLKITVDKLIESRELIRKRFQTEKQLTPEKITLNSVDRKFLEKIMQLMEEHMSDESYWVDQLASDMNTSRSTFFRKLKKITGQPPNDFIRMIRLKRGAQLLEQNQLTIAEISFMVGFSDPNYFGKSFRKIYGEAPSRYVIRKNDS